MSEKNFKVGDTLSLKVENQELTSKWCNNYQNTAGGVGVVTDSWGMISIFLSNGDASKLLKASARTPDPSSHVKASGFRNTLLCILIKEYAAC